MQRLETIFKELDESPKGKKCKVMEGLIEEGKEVMEEKAAPGVLDAAIIAAAQRVEHYEIAGYGCVRTFANLLGFDKAAGLLQETLDEEADADKRLTDLAESVINLNAEEEGEEGVGEEEGEEDEGGDENEGETNEEEQAEVAHGNSRGRK